MALSDLWDRYATSPELYVCSEPETTGPTVDRVLAVMPTEGRLLDLGCGLGRIAVPVAQSRPAVNVVGVDVSPVMIRMARPHSRVAYWLTDGVTIPAVGTVDGVWSVLLFQHLSVRVIDGYLAGLCAVMAVGAPLVVQFVAGDRTGGLDCRYRPEFMAGMVEAVGFVDVVVDEGVVHPDWAWITARRS